MSKFSPNVCVCGYDRSKAASTLAEVLAGIQEGRSGYKGEAFKQAVKEACGWGAAGGDGPLLEIVRSRVEVRTWCLRHCIPLSRRPFNCIVESIMFGVPTLRPLRLEEVTHKWVQCTTRGPSNLTVLKFLRTTQTLRPTACSFRPPPPPPNV